MPALLPTCFLAVVLAAAAHAALPDTTAPKPAARHYAQAKPAAGAVNQRMPAPYQTNQRQGRPFRGNQSRFFEGNHRRPFADRENQAQAEVDPPTAAVQAIIAKVRQLIVQNKLDDAEQTLKEALKEQQSSGDKNLRSQAELTSSLAACYLKEGEYDKARDYLEKLIDTLKEKDADGTRFDQLLARKRLGDAFYMHRRMDDALEQYKSALADGEKYFGSSDRLSRELLDAVVGTYMAEKQFKDAEPVCLKLIETFSPQDQQAPQGMDMQIFRGWAYLNLRQIYKETGKSEREIGQCQKEALNSFRRVMRTRMMVARQLAEGQDDLDKMFAHRPYKKSKIAAEQIWADVRLPRKSLPLLSWRNPRVKPWAALLCLHGLGLSSSSFDDMGRRLSEKGLAVTAMDVRGFGAFAAAKGLDDIDYRSSIDDAKLMLDLIHSLDPDTPLVLVGESMGGGIAVHVAAEYPKLVDALIASTPAAGRFDEMKTLSKVARQFICGPHKQFDIGSQVISQATDKASLKKEWKEDPKARLEMSALDLMKFDSFMKRNEEKAEKITDTPVLVLQGTNDHLVKPSSTFDLFEALKTDSKDLWMISNQEHLILEEGQCSDNVLEYIVNWMKLHAKSQQAALSQSN